MDVIRMYSFLMFFFLQRSGSVEARTRGPGRLTGMTEGGFVFFSLLF